MPPLAQESGLASLQALFSSDPLSKERVLKRMEILLSKASRKGLAMTTLVQRGLAELMDHGDSTQRSEVVSSMRDSAVHIMHTRDGARIACGCLRHGDAKDRKAILKAMKGFVARAAQNPHGSLMLCTALGVVDDTVLLSKALLSELQSELGSLALDAHGCLPLLQILVPRSNRYFTPEQLAVIGKVDNSTSKKMPEQRQAELLRHLLPALCKLCEAEAASLACSPHGSAVLFETICAADADSDGRGGSQGRLLNALAAAATTKESRGDTNHALLTHPIAARLLKRLAQKHSAFAASLHARARGKLLDWIKKGAAWVVLALLESSATASQVWIVSILCVHVSVAFACDHRPSEMPIPNSFAGEGGATASFIQHPQVRDARLQEFAAIPQRISLISIGLFFAMVHLPLFGLESTGCYWHEGGVVLRSSRQQRACLACRRGLQVLRVFGHDHFISCVGP